MVVNLFFSRYNNFQVVFTRRKTNGGAHVLAQTSISYVLRSDFRSPLDCIMNLLKHPLVFI